MFGFGIRKQQQLQQPRFAVPAYPASARHQTTSAYETMNYVALADGTVVGVPRANLAAAKGLLAARKAAERRVAQARERVREQQEWQAVVVVQELPELAREEHMAS